MNEVREDGCRDGWRDGGDGVTDIDDVGIDVDIDGVVDAGQRGCVHVDPGRQRCGLFRHSLLLRRPAIPQRRPPLQVPPRGRPRRRSGRSRRRRGRRLCRLVHLF